jgi:acyl carrier protein
MNNEIKKSVTTIMSVVFNVPAESINEHSSTNTISSWDSLKHMSLIVSLEEQLGCEFTDEQISEMTSFEKIIEIVLSLND